MRAPYYTWEEVEVKAARLHRQLQTLLGEPLEMPIDVDLIGEQLLGLSWLYELIPEPPGTTILAALHPEQRLVARAVHWAGAMQREHRIPVSELFRVEPVNADEPGRFRAYVPYVVKEAAASALRWVEASLHHYLTYGRLAEANEAAADSVKQRLARSLGRFGSSA